MRSNTQKKGIFCLEGLLDNDLANTSTVRGILNLLQDNSKIPYFYKDFAVWEELEFYLRKWIQKKYDKYPILYLSTHGNSFEIYDGRYRYSLDQLGDILEKQCENRMVMISSCSTMAADKRLLKGFLAKTGCLGVCGYRNDVNLLQAAAFELLLIAEMQENEFSGRGIEAIQNKAESIAKNFRELDFRMVTVKDLGC
jgi:hypothetical protein